MADTPEYATLTDVISRLDSKGEIAPIAEVLTLNNAILRRLKWKECNMTEGFREYCRKRYTVPLRTQLIAPIREGNSMKQNRVAFNFAPCKL